MTSMTEYTNPDWPKGLEDMESFPAEDRRNVIDPYKYWTVDAIKADLDSRRSDMVVILENFAHDLNIGSAIRNANGLVNPREVIIAGRRKWDRRGAVGSHNYLNLNHVRTTEDLAGLYSSLKDEGYAIVAFDNIEGSSNVNNFSWPKKSAIVLGQESVGLSPIALEHCDHLLHIDQVGTTRSLNVSCASAIAMYTYACQHPIDKGPN